VEKDIKLERSQLSLPLVVYLSNLPSPLLVVQLGSGFAAGLVSGCGSGCCPVVDGTTSSASTAVDPATEMPVAAVEVALK